jgi:hypothetical protein
VYGEHEKPPDPEMPSLPIDDYDYDSDEDGDSDYYKYARDPISDPDELITLKTILGYSAELLEIWKSEIARETYSLIETTGALEEVSPEWLEANKGKYDVIGTKFDYKEKIKPDGSPDKLKCRGALRGDKLTRLLLVKPPPTYSPCISNLTFMTVLSLAVILKVKKVTMDIISAYLQIAYPVSARPILVRLDKRICNLLGIDAKLRYRVKK